MHRRVALSAGLAASQTTTVSPPLDQCVYEATQGRTLHGKPDFTECFVANAEDCCIKAQAAGHYASHYYIRPMHGITEPCCDYFRMKPEQNETTNASGTLFIRKRLSPGSLQQRLQDQVDAVVYNLRASYPDLAISVAWEDAGQKVAEASGDTRGRRITSDDTFLYGSGTKPFTAAAILRLVDAGQVAFDDKVHAILDPYLKAHGKPSFAELLGDERANDATVLQLLRMGSGVPDFEANYAFDDWVLGNGSKFWDYPFAAINFSVSAQNRGTAPPLMCAPGECTAYSSTGYEVVGLLLSALLQPDREWYDFDLASTLSDFEAVKNMAFPPQGSDASSKLSDHLTVSGQTTSSYWPKTTVHDQNPSVLGWTCGNLVARPQDVASFFLHLLDAPTVEKDPRPILSNASRTEMTSFEELSTGWGQGTPYGAGLMRMQYGQGSIVTVQGHEGATYGFVSSQGYVPELRGAYSVATNVDAEYPMHVMVCFLLESAKRVITGSEAVTLGCSLSQTRKDLLVKRSQLLI